MRVKLCDVHSKCLMPRIKPPKKAKHITIEFLIDPVEDGSYIVAQRFETVILMIADYNAIISQWQRDQRLLVLEGAIEKPKRLTAKDFLEELRKQNAPYEKAIGYYSFF